MQSPRRWCCRKARWKSPTKVQKKNRRRHLISRREEAGHYKRQRAADNRPRSTRPNSSRGVAPHRQNRQAGKSTKAAAPGQSLLQTVRVEDRAHAGLRTSPDSARFTDFAQISPLSGYFVVQEGRDQVNARKCPNANAMILRASLLD